MDFGWLGWVPLLSVCVCLAGFGHLAQVPHCLRPRPQKYRPHPTQWSLPMLSKRAPDCFDVIRTSNPSSLERCLRLQGAFRLQGLGWFWQSVVVSLSDAYQGLQSARKNHPHSTQRSLPKRAQRAPKGPFGPLPKGPMGPLGPPSFAPVVKGTERHHDGARVRRSDNTTERLH